MTTMPIKPDRIGNFYDGIIFLEAFTPELKAAWSDAYTIITDIMMGAINDCNAN